MNLWRDLPAGPRPPELIHAIIEIPGNAYNT